MIIHYSPFIKPSQRNQGQRPFKGALFQASSTSKKLIAFVLQFDSQCLLLIEMGIGLVVGMIIGLTIGMIVRMAEKQICHSHFCSSVHCYCKYTLLLQIHIATANIEMCICS